MIRKTVSNTANPASNLWKIFLKDSLKKTKISLSQWSKKLSEGTLLISRLWEPIQTSFSNSRLLNDLHDYRIYLLFMYVSMLTALQFSNRGLSKGILFQLKASQFKNRMLFLLRFIRQGIGNKHRAWKCGKKNKRRTLIKFRSLNKPSPYSFICHCFNKFNEYQQKQHAVFKLRCL